MVGTKNHPCTSFFFLQAHNVSGFISSWCILLYIKYVAISSFRQNTGILCQIYTALCQGHINPKHLVTPASEFWMDTRIIFSIITAMMFSLHTMCISSNVPINSGQTTLRFTDHSRIVSPQHRICFMSSLWCFNFEVAPECLENLCTLLLCGISSTRKRVVWW